MNVERTLQEAITFHQKGMWDEAARLYKKILRHKPAHADALHLSGLLDYQTGNAARAIDLIGRALRINPDFDVARVNYANAYYAIDDIGTAEKNYRLVLEHDPDQPDALFGLSLCLYRRGELQECADACAHLTELQPERFEAWYQQACALNALDQLSAADACLGRALELHKDNAHWWAHRANIRQQMARYADAESDYSEAIRRHPGIAAYHHDLGMVLRSQGKLDKAEQAFSDAAHLDPKLVLAWISLGNLYRDKDNVEKSIESFERALRISPKDSSAFCYLGAARLQGKDPAGAMRDLERCHALNPYDRTALAFLAAAYSENDRPGDAEQLLNYKDLLASRSIVAPDGYESLGEFNMALADHVINHPTLQYERTGNTTRKGHQTGNLLDGEAGPVTELLTQIDAAVRDYFDKLPKSDDHPYLRWHPEQWRYLMWGVVLERQGHQDPHIHPDAWLSGVYYVSLPDDLGEQAGAEGYLEFGCPPARLNCSAEQPRRLIAPEAGKLMLFPSYFYHRTIPFNSDQKRISIAFDVRPLVAN